MDRHERPVLQVKTGFPWTAVGITVCVAIIGGFGLGVGYKSASGALAASRAEAGTAEPAFGTAEAEPAVSADAPAEPTPASEYAKYKDVGDTLDRCASTLGRKAYRETAKVYRAKNEVRAKLVYQAYADRLAERTRRTKASVSELADRAATKEGILEMMADGSLQEMQGNAFAATLAMDEAFSTDGLISKPTPEACDDFQVQVKFGQFDLAYF